MGDGPPSSVAGLSGVVCLIGVKHEQVNSEQKQAAMLLIPEANIGY